MNFAGMRLRGLRKCARPVSRIDKKKTRVNALEQLLDDSDEGSFSSRSSEASDSGLSYNESDDASESSDSYQPPKKKTVGDDPSESDEERCATSRRRRKRSASILNEHDDSTDSTESEDGGGLVRKAKQKKRLKLSDSEDESDLEREKETKIKEAAAKRKERKSKLVELLKQRKTASARRRRRTLGSEQEDEAENVEPESQTKAEDSENDSSEENPVHLIDSSEEEKQADTDSLKDFIVEDEEQKEEDEDVEEEETPNKDFFTHLPREFITGSQFTHFQVVIKALLINALDTSFLQSLYDGERTKRYAKEMKSSLHYFDERLVLPRLENLKQRSRWKERYKERVECYPKVRVIMVNVKTRNCEACELHRNGRFRVHLSGQLYHSTTLQEDQFMPDDSQTFLVGSVCASRTEVYHALKHYKYHLYVRCRTALKDHKEAAEEAQEVDDDDDDEPVKDTVNKLFTKLQDDGWISKQYEEFEECLNNADFFQEEKLD